MNDTTHNPKGEELALHFNVITNLYQGKEQFRAELTLTNNSEFPLKENWAIYFNFVRKIIPESISSGFAVTQINGDFFQLCPTKDYKDLKPNESVNITFNANFWVIKQIDAPAGFYIIYKTDEGEEFSPQMINLYTIGDFILPEQITRTVTDIVPNETAEARYKQNETLSIVHYKALTPILPSPVFHKMKKGHFQISAESTIAYQPHLIREAQYLHSFLKQHFGLDLNLIEGVIGEIQLTSSQNKKNTSSGQTTNTEAYSLSINSFGVQINGLFSSGTFYGIQSFLQLIPISSSAKTKLISVPCIEVQDQPMFTYRGIHLDVARNFHEVNRIKKLLDLISFYKLNKFHFHLTDDEGWRIEIKGLPELTNIGSRRGHDLTHTKCLVPSFGSGFDFKDPNSSGNGFYSREAFKELLKYANDRHIEVIPAIDLPGHALAAIKAMEVRYHNFKAAGDFDKANEFLLTDWNDNSEYESVQMWRNNVVNIALPSTYKFIEKVIDELILLYKEAKVELYSIHIGGDEVPEGSWLKSPACMELIEKHPDLNNVRDLSNYFITKVNSLLNKKGLQTAGWEEIALTHKKNKITPNESLIEQNLTAYTWNTMWGTGSEELPYKLANIGYNVVLCNAPSLYFDMAYNKHPEEAGYYWAGFNNTKDAFKFIPLDYYKSAEKDAFGNLINPENQYKDSEHLTENGKNHILGIQAQLWGETINSKERLEYLLFPRLFAVAERAWAANPKWVNIKDSASRSSAYNKEWAAFSTRISKFELPRLDNLFGGVQYRLPPPGAILTDGLLKANTIFPDLCIRYTTDGSDPDFESEEYIKPIPVTSTNIKFKTFATNGRSSRTSVIYTSVKGKDRTTNGKVASNS